MANRSFEAPRHGSLAYMPRKRARYKKGRIRNWPEVDGGEPRFIGYAGYKAGMTHVYYIQDQEGSPHYGKEMMKAVTLIETPPLMLFGIKVYLRDEYGMNPIGEVLAPMDTLNANLVRKIQLPYPENYDSDKKIKELEEKIEDLSTNLEVRGLFYTQPWLVSGVPKKKPDVFEIKVSGGKDAQEQFSYTKENLGKELRVRDCVVEGSLVDTIAVSKGKGYQGVVKRFGIKLLTRKNRKGKRRVGCIGPWKPARVMYSVPREGQMGFHQRTEYRKRILKMSEDPDEVNPDGGFIKY